MEIIDPQLREWLEQYDGHLIEEEIQRFNPYFIGYYLAIIFLLYVYPVLWNVLILILLDIILQYIQEQDIHKLSIKL